MTSNPNDVTSRLRRRLEAEREQIEETAASELRRLGESLNGVANDALRTIEADTALATGRLSAMLMRAWILPPGGRPEPVSRYLRRELGDDALVVDEHPAPDRDPGARERAHRAGPREPGRDRGDDVGGDATGDRRGAVRGAAGRLAGLSALDRGRAACREAIKRVKSCMTELERQLTAALERLSAQYETEQQRHSEQLSGQVTCLDADYRTLAATLRARWN